jgi:hypothetical protein
MGSENLNVEFFIQYFYEISTILDWALAVLLAAVS